MDYRAPPVTPLVLLLCNDLIAIEPNTGRRLWSWSNPAVVRRLFVVEDRVFPCVSYDAADCCQVHCLQLEDGRHLGLVNLPFVVDAGIRQDRSLVVAGDHGAALVSYDGAVVWQIMREFREHPVPSAVFHCAGPGGLPTIWEAPCAGDRRPPGLLFGDAVVQPDHVGRR